MGFHIWNYEVRRCYDWCLGLRWVSPSYEVGKVVIGRRYQNQRTTRVINLFFFQNPMVQRKSPWKSPWKFHHAFPHFHEKNWARRVGFQWLSQVAQLPTLFRRGVVPDNIIPKDGPFPVPREGENLEELCTEGGGILFNRNTGGLAQVKKK